MGQIREIFQKKGEEKKNGPWNRDAQSRYENVRNPPI